MKDDPVDPDVDDVIKEETSRGRRPVDTDARREHARRVQRVKKAIRDRDKRAFLDAMRAAGVKDGTPQFREAVELWNRVVGNS